MWKRKAWFGQWRRTAIQGAILRSFCLSDRPRPSTVLQTMGRSPAMATELTSPGRGVPGRVFGASSIGTGSPVSDLGSKARLQEVLHHAPADVPGRAGDEVVAALLARLVLRHVAPGSYASVWFKKAMVRSQASWAFSGE